MWTDRATNGSSPREDLTVFNKTNIFIHRQAERLFNRNNKNLLSNSLEQPVTGYRAAVLNEVANNVNYERKHYHPFFQFISLGNSVCCSS